MLRWRRTRLPGRCTQEVKEERSFLCAAVLGADKLRSIAPDGSVPSSDALFATLRDRKDLAQRHGMSKARLAELCNRRLPRLVDIALRNEDLTHYESILFADLHSRHRQLSSSALAERVYQSPEYFELLKRTNIANCRECSNAIGGILSREHSQLKVATVASNAHDHQFVLVGMRLPNRLEDVRDLEPDTLVVDPWKGTFRPALDAFLARDAFKNGYELSSLRYTNVFYDPLED